MNVQKTIRKFVRSSEIIVLAILLLVMCAFYILNPAFLTVRNMFDLLRTMIVTGIFACGVMIVIISGGIDMSFMAIAICSAYMTVRFSIANAPQLPFIVLALISMVIGILLGMCNAFLVNTFEMPIFIATLSFATTVRGLMLAFVGNEYIPSPDMPPALIEFSKMYCFNTTDATGSTFGLHLSVFIMLGVMIITHLIMRYTIIGRGVYALGGDMTSATRIGYNIKRLRRFLYGYAGCLAGLGGIIYVANNRMADPMSFQGEELTVIAAVVLGGTSISGGKGSVIGIFLGLMLTNVINNNLVIIGIDSYWQKFTFGLLVIVAVVIQSIRAKRAAKM